MPRYLLVSQSSIPALQAMWKLACEGTPATLGPLEAAKSEKYLQVEIITFKRSFALLCETLLLEPSGLEF